MAVNSEAIYSTRPWKVAGQEPTQSSGARAYDPLPRFAPGDMRLTTRGDALYAIALAWPTDGKLVIRSLATGSLHLRRRDRRYRTAGLGAQSRVVAEYGRSHDQPAGETAVRLRLCVQDQTSGRITGIRGQFHVYFSLPVPGPAVMLASNSGSRGSMVPPRTAK